MLGTHWAAPLSMGLAFVDGNLRIGSADTDFSVNFGGGFRWRNDDFFTGSPRIFGVSVWYDGEDTQLDNYFNQIGVSFERLGPLVDLRLNANIPLEDVKQGDDVMFTGDTVFSGNNISQGTLVSSDVSLRTVDFEVAPRLFNLNAWAYAGGYQMDGQGISELGRKGGVRGYILNDLALDVGVHDDDQFGTNTVVQVIWTPGRVSADPSLWTHNIDDRMREQVYRNPYVAVDQIQTAGAVALTDVTGDDIRVVHVDSTAPAGGDGSFENPLNNLNDIQGNSQVGDIILVHSQSTFTGENATLQDAQRFLGEGLNNDGDPQNHFVITSELGQIELPESAPGASDLARPVINNASGSAAVVLAGGNDEVDALGEIEVSNFTIAGGARGVHSPTGVGDVNINQLQISNTTGDGIELTPLLETLANNSERLRFTPSIDDVVFSNVGGDDIDLNATTTEPTSTAISETIAISDITSDDGAGVGIRLTEHKRAATISNFDWDGGTTGEGALLIESDTALNLTQATVAMSGTNTITGGATGVAGEGYAIRINEGVATHTIGGTTITNTGGDSIIANGPGTAGMNFTGRIEQTANNAAILNVAGGHDGNLTFTELTANAGVINATTGTGLQFNDADGVYTFNDNVNIEGAAGAGATAAVNVIGDSSAVLTFTDATFDNINGDAIRFVGGTANMTLTGRVTQTLNAQSILDVSGGHDGTLTFNQLAANPDVIMATTGDGLQFNNADGAYTFNDAIDLEGTSEGIDITNGSSGTFAFSDTASEINNTTGTAVNIESSDAIFTYAGEINANSTAGRPVRIANNTGGSATFSGLIDSDNLGVLVENNTGGSVLFSGEVNLTTGLNNGVTIQNNTGGSARFNNLEVITTSGTGFLATNNATPASIAVAGAGNTISTATGVGLNLNNVNVDAGVGVNFASVSVANGGANGGILLNNVTGGIVNVGSQGAAAGDGGTIASSGAAVQITNVASASINNMILSSTGGQGVNYSVTNAAASRLVLNRNNINMTAVGATEGILMDVSGNATIARITLTNNTVSNTSDDEAVRLQTSGASAKTVNLLLTANNISNDSATAPAANFIAGQATTLNANITSANQFNNTNVAPGQPFRMESANGSSIVRLNLNGNNATATSGAEYFLVETAGNFSVEDLATVDANNGGEVDFDPAPGNFTDDPGGIPTP
jgi:hypothetical protein